MKENMTQRIKAFIVLLAATVATAGTAWGQSNETLGYINYTQGSDDGGTLTFYRMSTAYVDDEIAITNGKSAAIPIAAPNEKTVTLIPEKDGGNNIGYRIYFKFTPDGRHLIRKDNGYSNEEKVKFTVEVTTGTGDHMNAPRRAPGLGDDIPVSEFGGGLFYFIMPADPNLNVTISVVSAPEKPKLGDEGYDHHDYIDASGNVVNTAALKDGDNNPVPVYWLDGTEPVLGVSGKTTWYYCSGIHDYGSLPFLGDVCIILGDEKVQYSGQKYNGAMLSSLGLGSDGKTLTLLTASGATGCLNANTFHGSLIIPNRYFVYSSSNGYNTDGMYGIRNGSATVAITGDALNALNAKYLRPFAGRIVSLTGDYVAVDPDPNNEYDYRLSDAHVGNTNYYIYRDPVQTVTLNKVVLDGIEGMSIDSGKSIEWSINSVTFTDNINEATGDEELSLTANLGDAVPTNAYNYIDGQGALRNQDNHYASFTMPASGDVNVSMSLNPFTQPGGYCGNSSVNEGKNLVWTVTDEGTGTDKVRTLTIKKNPDDTAISGQTDFTMADYASAEGQPWKSYRSEVVSAVIGSGVTSIGASAFMNCENMATVSIPSSVTSIGNNAFSNSGLTAITLNEGLQTIGDAAFFTKLTTINIPASVEAIGANPFGDVETITVDENSTHFKTDHDIALLTYDGTTLIQYAKGNTETTSYAVPDGVTRIGANAFSNSDHLTDVVIPASVESIGEYGFNSCSKLATIRVFRGAANGITTIGEDAFTMRSSDPAYSSRRIYVPKSALEVYCAANIWKDYASKIVAAPWGDALRGGFCGVDDATTTTVDESKNVAWALTANGDDPEGCDTGSGLTLTISKNPEVTAEGADFSMADGWPFDDGDGGIDEVTTALSITQAVIGEGVTNIGARAFQNCWNMATVSIPSSVTSIGTGAFVECKSLTSNITIPDGVTVINNSTFNGCAKLTTVVLPSGLTTIGASAFAGCYKLESIGVANSETNELPTSLTTIGVNAFSGSGLPAITLNEGLETIAGDAFNRTGLTTINIPASVENIGEGAFTCFFLESISVADGNTHFTTDGKALIAHIDDNNKTLLTYARVNTATSYTVPDGVTRIGAGAFSDSHNLTEVTLPEGLKTIGDHAFEACDAITDIAIPASVESIGTEGFGRCYKLATIRVFRGGDAITTIGQNAFTMSSLDPACSSRRIYVPLSALETYRTAVNWEKYYSGDAYWIFAGDETELFSSTATNAWMTWCSDKAYGKPVGCKAYTVSAVSGGEVTLTPVAGLLLPAYTPLLIKRDDTSAALTAIGGAAVTEPESGYNTTTGLVTKAETGFSMLGAATDAPVSNSITAGYSYALFDGEFLKIDDSTLDIPAHRCILTLDVPLSASRLHININGEATSLSEAKEDSSLFTLHSSLSGWYTLDGRKLDKQPTVKGLYIYKGKKVVIK